MTPGLARRNPIGRSALSFRDLVEQLQAAAEQYELFKLVVSDAFELTRQGLIDLAAQCDHEWTGPALDDIAEEQYIVYFDILIASVRPRSHKSWVELELGLVV